MTTILTLEPLGGNLLGGTMAANFGGAGLNSSNRTTRAWLGQPTNTLVTRVNYPADMTHFSIVDGVVALDKLIKATAGDVLVFAHSQGAQVVSRWLRTRGAATEAGRPSTSRVSFLLIGNPLRKYGGYGVGRPEFDGKIGVATPTNSGYPCTDYTLQYDGWSDSPTRAGMWAAANSNQDRYGINGARAIHAWGYRTASLTASGRKTYTENGTTFVLAPHAPLLRVPRSWIERGYARPES